MKYEKLSKKTCLFPDHSICISITHDREFCSICNEWTEPKCSCKAGTCEFRDRKHPRRPLTDDEWFKELTPFIISQNESKKRKEVNKRMSLRTTKRNLSARRKQCAAAGRKGALVTNARNAFLREFGPETYDVVSRLLSGHTTSEVADLTGVSTPSVATTKGNLTRGIYDRWVWDCNFR